MSRWGRGEGGGGSARSLCNILKQCCGILLLSLDLHVMCKPLFDFLWSSRYPHYHFHVCFPFSFLLFCSFIFCHFSYSLSVLLRFPYFSAYCFYPDIPRPSTSSAAALLFLFPLLKVVTFVPYVVFWSSRRGGGSRGGGVEERGEGDGHVLKERNSVVPWFLFLRQWFVLHFVPPVVSASSRTAR